MRARLVPGRVYNAGSGVEVAPEPHADSLRFHHHKITRRTRPGDPRRTLIVPVFGEFGCEVVSAMYVIPRLLQKFPGYYSIVAGWHGREYLYRHLVDEFWELGEEHQWLREYCRAFHHNSVNLERFEKTLRGKEGLVVSSRYMGRQTLVTECRACNGCWREEARPERCRVCASPDLRRALFFDVPDCWSSAAPPPPPSAAKVEWARGLLPDNPVGIFARARACYGRNLPAAFYVSLVDRLRSWGYSPVWLGEPCTTLPCPCPGVVDFTAIPEQRDLECTLAIVSQLRFTVQFWTASTRLAALAGTPFVLFESPDQLWGNGQEGYRLELVARGGPRKVVANHFLNVLNDHRAGLDLLEGAVGELVAGDYSDSVGLVDEPAQTRRQMEEFHARAGRPRTKE